MFKAIKKIRNELKCSALFGKASRNHSNENYEKALSILDRIITLDPPDYMETVVLGERGEIEYRLGRYQASIDNLSLFIERAEELQSAGKPSPTLNKHIERAKEFLNAAKART